MNLELTRKILGAIEARPDGCLQLRARQKLREAEFMRAQGWIQLSTIPGKGVVARMTDAGERISRLFKDEAVAQRLRDAFSPRGFGDR